MRGLLCVRVDLKNGLAYISQLLKFPYFPERKPLIAVANRVVEADETVSIVFIVFNQVFPRLRELHLLHIENLAFEVLPLRVNLLCEPEIPLLASHPEIIQFLSVRVIMIMAGKFDGVIRIYGKWFKGVVLDAGF